MVCSPDSVICSYQISLSQHPTWQKKPQFKLFLCFHHHLFPPQLCKSSRDKRKRPQDELRQVQVNPLNLWNQEKIPGYHIWNCNSSRPYFSSFLFYCLVPVNSTDLQSCCELLALWIGLVHAVPSHSPQSSREHCLSSKFFKEMLLISSDHFTPLVWSRVQKYP